MRTTTKTQERVHSKADDSTNILCMSELTAKFFKNIAKLVNF